MQDRVSNYPGRWKLTPVTGTTDTYDFERADDPTVEGTKLNKATFLPDAVASAIEAATGGSNINLPADALNAIATALSSIGLTKNCKISYGSWSGTGYTGGRNYQFSNPPRLVFACKNGGFPFGDATKCAFLWAYNMTSDGTRTFSLNGNTLSWSNSTAGSTGIVNNLNESGATYYIVGVCEKT